jgi:hypothetical protein
MEKQAVYEQLFNPLISTTNLESLATGYTLTLLGQS